jgi:toxin-antitoxin system PIN domain toxin
MAVFLLDANALIALVWPSHEHHLKVQTWFSQRAKSGWATCPFTQAAVVRILTNPAFSSDAISPEQAIDVLQTVMKHHAHQFWKDDISVPKALSIAGKRLVGHQQITDAYLLGLADHYKGAVATLDRALPALLSPEEQKAGRVTLI